MAIDVKQLQQVIASAQQADAFKSEVKRALHKVSSLLQQLQMAVEETEGLLSPDYTPAVKTRKAQVSQEAVVKDAEVLGRKKDKPLLAIFEAFLQAAFAMRRCLQTGRK